MALLPASRMYVTPYAGNAAELVMVEQDACEWCEAWDMDIGIVYDKTPEGQIAPLRRVDIHDPLPGDLEFIRRVIYTPTFVLTDGGKEVGRIIGYPREDFFWGLLLELMDNLPASGTAHQTPPKQRSRAGIAKEKRG